MGSADAAEGGLREAIRLCDAETGKEVDMQAECARRELAYLLMGLDGRAGEAEPLLRKVLEMLQARAAPMTLWLDVRSPLSPLAAAALRCLTARAGCRWRRIWAALLERWGITLARGSSTSTSSTSAARPTAPTTP